MAKYSSAIIGHATLDTNTDHLGNTVKIVGGAVIYSSASAYALGHRVAAVTKIADKDMDRLEQFTIPKEDIYCLPSERSTDMVNIYHTADKERRTCSCLSKGDPFCAEELPDLDASIYHLAGLVFGDFNHLLTFFECAFVRKGYYFAAINYGRDFAFGTQCLCSFLAKVSSWRSC